MLTQSCEQRKSLRTRRAATISFDVCGLSVPCVIWDISECGARLAVAHPLVDLPHHFTLHLFKDDSVQRCELIWMDRRFVGVKFVDFAS
jgi:hypothetical protein